MTEKLLFIHIQQDPSKRVSPERIHELEVAVYDLLDENQFDVCEKTGPYHLYLKTDLRHVYFDVRDQRNGTEWVCDGPWPVPADHA